MNKKTAVLLMLCVLSFVTAKVSLAQDNAASLITPSKLNLNTLASSIEKLRVASDAASFAARSRVSETSSIHRQGNPIQTQTAIFYCSIISEQNSLFVQQFCDPSWTPLKKRTILLKGEQAQVLKFYSEKGVDYSEGTIGERRHSAHNVFAKTLDNADPRYYTYYAADYPIDQIMLRKTRSVLDKWPQPIITGETTLFNSMCVLVEVPLPDNAGAYVYALDKTHNYVIRQCATYMTGSKGRVLKDVLNVPKLVQHDGNWYPLRVEESVGKAFPYPRADYGSVERIVDFTLSPVEDDSRASFEDIQWPLGCSVVDLVDNKSFTVVSNISSSIGEGATSTLSRVEDDPNVRIGLARPVFKPSQAIPPVTFTDAEGHKLSLENLKGKRNVILTFFPKCFTGGCTNHLSSLQSVKGKLDAAQTQVIAVSVDPADGEKGQKAFAKKWGLQFSLVPDTDRHISQTFGAAQDNGQLSARMTFLIDKQGIVRWVDTDVNVQTHGPDMLVKLRELGMIK